MKKKIFIVYLILIIIALPLFHSCNDADNYYADLTKKPQINLDGASVYDSSYFVGDTMKIKGKLIPEIGLKIEIGGIEAKIIDIKKIEYTVADTQSFMEQASVVIDKSMLGDNKEVKISSGGQSINGPHINVMYIDPKASDKPMSLEVIKALPMYDLIVPIRCFSRKGDMFYYNSKTQSVVQIKKTGESIDLISTAYPLQNYNFSQVSNFVCGAISPDEKMFYWYADGLLMSANLITKTASVLNNKTDNTLAQEGNIQDVYLNPGTIEANDQGNLYLGDKGTDSYVTYLKYYDATQNKVTTILNAKDNGPGQSYANVNVGEFKSIAKFIMRYTFSIDEELAYVCTSTIDNTRGIAIIDIKTKLVINYLPVSDQLASSQKITPIGLFSNLKGAFVLENADNSFGMLAFPGRRLYMERYQKFPNTGTVAPSGFPKWVSYDFTTKRALPLAPGKFDNKGYLSENGDVLLNMDEDGNIYYTTGNLLKFVRTISH